MESVRRKKGGGGGGGVMHSCDITLLLDKKIAASYKIIQVKQR